MDEVHDDPLSINLHRQRGAIISFLGDSIISTPTSPESIVIQVSDLLFHRKFTTLIASAFRPILSLLCARWLDQTGNNSEKLDAFASLLNVHEELFPIFATFIRQTSFASGLLNDIQDLTSLQLHFRLLSYYRILFACPHAPMTFNWSPEPLFNVLQKFNGSRGIICLAVHSYAIHTRMSESRRDELLEKYLGPVGDMDVIIESGFSLNDTKETIDGWVLPLSEALRVQELRENLTVPNYYYQREGFEPTPRLDLDKITPRIADVEGILLLKQSYPSKISNQCILTSVAKTALRAIALRLSLRLPILLSSPPSGGKSSILRHLASLLYPAAMNQLVTVHLADASLDAKSLFGSYVSSTKRPGNFEWQDGVIAKAMREGWWLVLEDIDRANSDVLGALIPVLEGFHMQKHIGSPITLQLSGRPLVVAAYGFAIFATRSIIPRLDGSFPDPSFLGAHKFSRVDISPLAKNDLLQIISEKYPAFVTPIASLFVDVWLDICRLSPVAGVRSVGIHDLETWCKRVSYVISVPSILPSEPISFLALFPNIAIREEIYVQARDVFFGTGAFSEVARVHYDAISRVIAEHLSLDSDRIQWIMENYRPEMHVRKDSSSRILSLTIGRICVPAAPVTGEPELPSRLYATHRSALLLLERVATCVSMQEPVLLVGETGTGKTTTVSYLSSLLCRPLVSLNLSNQTESSDLLGSFKPIDARIPAGELQQRFIKLFALTFSRKKNAKFEQAVRLAVGDSKWKKAAGLWKECVRLALEKIQARNQFEKGTVENGINEENSLTNDDGPRKRRRLFQNSHQVHASNWIGFMKDVEVFEMEHVQKRSRLAFRFVEGPLVRALRDGSWVLLDEINLASSETLECISSILNGPNASIVLGEQGTFEPIPRHPDFRLFACMNPATDVGKKDLPMNIRTRFTEIYVPSPDTDKDALLSIVQQYIGHCAITDKAALLDVVEFYIQAKAMGDRHELADGSNRRPHFSIRTLARALMFASHVAATFGLRRALWEGCLMAFSMGLEAFSAVKVRQLAERLLLSGIKNVSSTLAHVPSLPLGSEPDKYERIGAFWIECGDLQKDPVPEYILTPSVRTKLIDLARIIHIRRFPILIEGPTSSGKTSAVEYLARRTGHRFVRINNHEHTDIQEYLGSYVSDPDTGRLVFKDGMLVRALRNGDWIVLDELNLAPTDVLEALNRLLDDNRELFIPETQEVIQPHPHFMLFATQNPPGLYAGRKQLSRAFRSRFLEVHFDDVPQSELQFILSERCRIPESYAEKIVNVFQELGKRRQANRVFEAKHGFATLRDLFRWGSRDAATSHELAKNGYMILAERARRQDDKAVVKEVIESVMKESIVVDELYKYPPPDIGFSTSTNIIWTSSMRRLFVLVATALKYNEPVLLVGETGAGKTSVCQLYASAIGKELITLNCHQSTETSDLIGSQRPIRNRSTRHADLLMRCQELAASLPEPYCSLTPQTIDEVPLFLDRLNASSQPSHVILEVRELRLAFSKVSALFEWKDGPLVQAMQEGNVFLLDEISLADDSVLERLNSVLETSRSVVLAEKGGVDVAGATVIAHPEFKLLATMNPGGDYGKKELSPALRNRFTEIWVPSIDSVTDLQIIIDKSWQHECLREYTHHILSFRQWISSKLTASAVMSMRDILTVVTFMNKMVNLRTSMTPSVIFHHAIHMACLDGLETSAFTTSWTLKAIRQLRQEAEVEISKIASVADIQQAAFNSILNSATHVSVGPFNIIKGTALLEDNQDYNYVAPTTLSNISRISRACQLDKPILLEGSPGVGKTSLVSAFSHLACQRLVRINLSDQTELIDLFGTDYPVEGGDSSFFAWKEAAFLQSMRNGDWVLLDEMNLATQTVLEGLNAILDHRGSVFIPELGQTFPKHENFRIFAAQNPLGQGGGRKGLPKSFLDRFTKVYIQTLTLEDMYMICRSQFPNVREGWVRSMVLFNSRLQDAVIDGYLGKDGGPWEFNIRDVLRWTSLLSSPHATLHPSAFLDPLYIQRFRTSADRERVINIFREVFGTFDLVILQKFSYLSINSKHIQLGGRTIRRGDHRSWHNVVELQRYWRPLSAAGICVDKGWLTIISGAPQTGKTQLIRLLAAVAGFCLQEVSLSSGMDTGDILGSFEQVDGGNDSVQFGWVDGPLLSAMKEGHWLMFDNANLCSPSVLDRLNSLCEPNGFLSLTERGHVNGSTEVIYPHPDFRLILLLDPRNGELSRAMRNRGIEIHLLDGNISGQDALRLFDASRISLRLFPSFGLEQDLLNFEKMRRGCLSGVDPKLDPSVTPRPGCLIYDSTLRALWDNVMLQKLYCSRDDSFAGYASTDLLVRQFTPVAFPLLGSYVKLLRDKQDIALINILKHISTDENVFRSRASFALVVERSIDVPSTVIISQPLDILLRHEAWSSMDDSLVPLMTTFSHILGLVVRLHFSTVFRAPERSFFQQSYLYYSCREKPANASPSIASLYPLYLETTSLVTGMISKSVPTLLENPESLREMEMLLDFAEHLRDSALQPFLNFSSAIVTKQWYLEILDGRSNVEYCMLRDCLERFSEAVQLTSGSKMRDIWKAFTCHCPLATKSSQMPSPSNETPSIRSNSATSENRVSGDHEGSKYSSVLTVVELGWILSMCKKLCGISDKVVRESNDRLLVDVAQHFGNGTSHFASCGEQVLSMFSSNEGTCPNLVSHVTSCLKYWMKGTSSFVGQDVAMVKTGSAVLLAPVLLQDVFSLCFGDTTFQGLSKQHAGLTLHARILFDQCEQSLLDRFTQLYVLWVGFIFLLAKCFEDTYTTENWQGIHCALTSMDAFALATSLTKTSDRDLLLVVTNRILPISKSLGHGGNMLPSRLAKAWVEFGLCLLDLYLPDFPMDPLAIEKSTFDFLKKREGRVSTLLKFAELAAECLYGDKATPLSSTFDTELEIVRKRLQKHSDPSFRVVDLNRLQSLFDEMRPFMKQFIFNDKFSNMIAAIARSTASVPSQEIFTISANVTGFLQRLDKSYTDLSDIVHPISLALSFIQFGLHLFIPISEMNTSTKSIAPLTKFPTVAAINETGTLIHGNSNPEQLLLCLLASSYKYVLEYRATTDFIQVGKTYDKIAALWLKQNNTQEQQERASQSLYRHKAAESSSVDDNDELESLFPSFLEKPDDFPEATTKQKLAQELAFSQNLKHVIYTTHHMVTCEREGTSTLAKLEEQYWRLRYDLLFELLRSEDPLAEFDKDTLSIRLSLIWKNLIDQSHQGSSYNFYYDSNVSETKAAISIVQNLRERLEELIREWPDQMILQHILDRCNAILQLSAHSSIARVLASLEQLIMQLADWESYANRENSLAVYQGTITDKIISWRRMELASWSSLFEWETSKFELDTIEWWVRMYDLTVRGPLHAEHLDTYLTEMISVIDEFISTSSLGHFNSRLQLVASFAEHIRLLNHTRDVEESERLLRVGRTLHNLYNYYTQFANSVSRVVKERRNPLEKELQDHVKLASWRDQNVYALQQSAQRTHRQLYKCIRKFREVLKESVAPSLSVEELDSESESSATGDYGIVFTITDSVDLPASGHRTASEQIPFYLTNLSKTLVNFRQILQNSGDRFVEFLPYRDIEGFAVEILEVSTQLASDTDIAGSDLKTHKVLLMRKRRAWVDLLQRLKQAGFSSRVKPNVLQRQKDRLWLLDHPSPHLKEDDHGNVLTSKNRTYFNRLLVSVPALRNSFSSHHSDITTGDFQRALNFVESCYSFFLAAYTRYCTDYNQYEILRKMADRLLWLSNHPSPDVYVEDLDAVRLWLQTCLGLQDALKELLLNCNRLTELNSSFLLSSSVLGSITQCINTMKEDGETLHHLQQRAACLRPSFINSDEMEKLHLIRDRIASVSTSLQEWSEYEPKLQHFCRPILTWLNESMPSKGFAVDPEIDTEVSQESERKVIESLLLTAQEIRLQGLALSEASESEGVALTSASLSTRLSAALGVNHVVSKVDSFLSDLRGSSPKDRLRAVRRVTPFLNTYLQLADSMLRLQAFYGKASGKLTYVLTRLLLSLSQKGFCKPPDTEGQQVGEGDAEGLEDGTGFGEGKGKEDVGHEVGDESQVEGLRDESKDSQEDTEQNQDGEGIGMDGMDGETRDMDDDDESVPESDEPRSDIDDIVENLDKETTGKIDEKLWEGEHEDEKPQNDQAGKDSKNVGKDVAPQTDETSKDSNLPVEEAMQEDVTPDEDNLPEGDNAPPIDAGKQLEKSVPEESVLDLPDDIDIDQSDKGDSASDFEDNNGDVDQEVEDIASQLDAQSIADDVPGEDAESNEQILPLEEDSQQQQNDVSTAEDVAGGSMEDSSRGTQGDASKPNLSEDASMADDSMNNPEATDTAVSSSKENLSLGNEGANQGANMSAADNGAMDVDQHDNAGGEPIAMGDVSRPVHRHWEDISSANATQPSVSSSELPSRVEHLPENLDDPNDLQALGPAKDRKPVANEDIQMPDDEEETTRQLNGKNDDHIQLSDSMVIPPRKEASSSKPRADRPLAESQTSESHEQSMDATASGNLPPEVQMLDMLGDMSISEENVEQITKKWCEIGRPESLAGHVWRLYESLTRDLSFTLCEQLRLILAPTLATRLKGDYKTGKKLNMKKIIPYIASDYTKDKIWLRRTRPSQREYQILIALDDSRSMGEGHSIHLAYETLALVTKALNRLEAGEIAVASFGESFELVHRFEDGMVGEREGEKLMKSFKFSQSKTDILELIQSSVNALLEAREHRSISSSSSSGELWQLEIIVSDGICQDHEQLRNALRMAEENRILVVFIIIDSLHDQAKTTNNNQPIQNSILTMNQVSYQNINGKMELQLARYLDTFPFQYYLILREVEALPDVLANTLKQFFERISEQ